MRRLLLLLLLPIGGALAPAGASADALPRVIGGVPVVGDGWPSVVRIEVQGSTCTGALIAPDAVLTAAHCVIHADGSPIPPRSIAVRLGVDGSIAAPRVVKVRAHPEFDESSRVADVAVLELAGPAGPKPVTLARASVDASVTVGTSLRVVGWGRTSDIDPTVHPTVAQTALLSVQGGASCATVDGFRQYDDVCLSNGGQDAGPAACLGDDGAPLFLDGRAGIVAMVTSGSDRDCSTAPGVARRIRVHRAWIEGAAAELPAPTLLSVAPHPGMAENAATVDFAVDPYGYPARAWLVGHDGRVLVAPVEIGATYRRTSLRFFMRTWTRKGVRVIVESTAGMVGSQPVEVATTDRTRPFVRTRDTTGRRGRLVRLRIRVADNSGRARVRLDVLRNGRLRTRRTRLVMNGVWWATTRLPRNASAASWRFCAVATDLAGNRQRPACSRIRIMH